MSADWRSDILKFWFGLEPEQWWRGPPELDHRIRQQFLKLWAEKRQLPADRFLDDSLTALAAVILFDQFPRNMFRGQPRSFAADAKALAVAQGAVGRGFDRQVPRAWRKFFYLPFEHAEDREAQARSVALFEALGEAEAARYAVLHRDIIDRFGRFPHRNAILGRESTPEEAAWLAAGGETFGTAAQGGTKV